MKLYFQENSPNNNDQRATSMTESSLHDGCCIFEACQGNAIANDRQVDKVEIFQCEFPQFICAANLAIITSYTS